ncbi:DUF1146 family protein [Aneurinibacillus aneurinilyticus]|jgi:uncharacterized integral membrane protein (TIGR02327 family)|uniref:DUF1146 domain-containing protein n=2 Tax=Aneurinibacillus aneurinilyticus TaxID=1391 RepID=A0A848CVV3_ANEAE|nr:DUF1146 family protein [Aneurinibacillus aneurinilyticus]MCI1694675.1 DUF1146 family protein [Aneurinibacillus aneurinilyticus]MED0671897.1 DUF1146 family protein [Aneurinibacillus aneurinilyticus]MED0706394.1 DUF1146 family protein [Aneurinibacillus aneurinilyticus]MED0723668.1 DUF1146 family protein [Aneurinibacillus aneurinilyticus]MED0730650.1 DUF1146 family protein [Aneurinibacillus aneurinilyticus]
MMAIAGVINILLSLVFIALSFWALQAFRFDLFVSNPKGPRAILLQIFLSIFIGHGVASFFTEYFGWTQLLRQFF